MIKNYPDSDNNKDDKDDQDGLDDHSNIFECNHGHPSATKRNHFKLTLKCSAAKQKLGPTNLKSDFYHIFTKNQTKSGPKLTIVRKKSHLFKKLYFKVEPMKFYLKIFISKDIFKYILALCERLKELKE